jgi:hypothetical protein
MKITGRFLYWETFGRGAYGGVGYGGGYGGGFYGGGAHYGRLNQLDASK